MSNDKPTIDPRYVQSHPELAGHPINPVTGELDHSQSGNYRPENKHKRPKHQVAQGVEFNVFTGE